MYAIKHQAWGRDHIFHFSSRKTETSENFLQINDARMGVVPVSPSTKSPERKRPKQPGKPRQQYVFRPLNTLAYNPQAGHGSKQREGFESTNEPNLGLDGSKNLEARSTDGTRHSRSPEFNRTGGDILVPVNASGMHGDACTSTPLKAFIREKTHHSSEKSSEQQSSDDTFDGVRWKPAKMTPKAAKTLPLSPLRNVDFSLEKPAPVAPLVNEITGSMLTKYGLALGNQPSQTPRLTRTTLDGVTPFLDALPTLARSKSFDPRCLPPTELLIPGKASRLSTWIDKFDDVSQKKSDSVSSPEQGREVEDDDAFSSEDDAFLASLKCESLPPLLQLPSMTETLQVQNAAMSISAKNSSAPEESDPFSDDLDIAAIENVLTQPSTALSSFATVAEKIETGAKPMKIKTLDVESSEVKAVETLSDRGLTETSFGPKLSYSRPEFTRYQVQDVLKTTYQLQNFKKKQLILTVTDANDQTSKLLVRGESAELEIKQSDIVHVILTAPENPRLVSDSHNLLIWNPDTLISSTTVADQLDCPRKTVLNKRLSFPGELSLPLLTGTIVHEIFQLCFISGKCTNEYMESLLEIEIAQRLLDIYTMGDVVEELKTKIRTHLPYIHKWFHSYYRKAPSEIPTNKRQQKIRFSVAEILDIEERVVSPMFGIKGIADVTLRANLESDTTKGQFLLPMEIKTGQPYILHQAQAALYSLLFKDRYNVDIASFLLVYTLNEGSTIKHDISVSDLKSLVNLRNRISVFLQLGSQGLPNLMRQQKCDRCFVQESCMTYNFLTEEGTAEDSDLKEGVFEDLTAHLEGKENYKEFLMYWDVLLSKEEEFMSRFEKELWVYTAKEREEKLGKSLGNLVISGCITSEESQSYIYTFCRKDVLQSSPAFNASQILKHDRVIVSDEKGHFALAQGYVRHIDAESITISSKRQIITTELKTDSFHRAGVLRASQKVSQDLANAVVFRLDKDEMFYGMGVARYNVLNLFQAEGDHKRRELIVDLRPPTFSEKPLFKVDTTEVQFNECQRNAFDKVSRTNDYSLVLGMPGTGKTTLIASLIRMLVAAKKTVLLTSYTHSAVDNILLKVREFDIDFLRIGLDSRVHQGIKEFTPGSERNRVNSYADFQRVYSKPYVVAATCLSVQDPAFNIRKQFDYCIVDEASQVSMPISLGPLSLCDKFILVGDHYQLPPLVSHPDATVKAGLSQSLFQILANAHPNSVVELKHQYRMCEDIMLISNKLVYKNRLRCGNEEVANQTLHIPHPQKISAHVSGELPRCLNWLQPAFQEENKVLFYDHDLIPGYERQVGENTTNPTEVELVRQTVEALCLCGVEPSKIGIMTLYRSQLKLLAETFRHIPELEILTADRFQGRDKDCIIISMVRSNRDRRTGDLMKDWRRINVAVTRARSKLIVFGSVATLSNAESVSDFVTLAKRNGWVYELPEDALKMFHFEKSRNNLPTKAKVASSRLSAKAIGKHALVLNILADMNVA